MPVFFQKDNGRISRIIQSLVLALGGLPAPEFVTIEEYLGGHTTAYYAALGEVHGGSYQPQRDATPFVRLCVQAHLAQARRRLLQLQQASERWAYLEQLVERRGWPDRLVVALEQSMFQGTDRAAYAGEADVSSATASNDLRRSAGRRAHQTAGQGSRHTVRGERAAGGGGSHSPRATSMRLTEPKRSSRP